MAGKNKMAGTNGPVKGYKFMSLSYNISEGSARRETVSPKTWRIFTSADARMTPLVPNPRGNYH
jgi:hypothetical protein